MLLLMLVSNNSADLSLVQCGGYTNEFYLTKCLITGCAAGH